MAGKLMRGETVASAYDQFFSPLWIEDAVTVINRLLSTRASGLMHLCGPARVSRLELSLSLAAALGVPSSQVKPISLRDLDENFRRPLDTSMVCGMLRNYADHPFRGIQDCIGELAMDYRKNFHRET